MVTAMDSPPDSRGRGLLRRWIFAALLILPATVPYLSHYLADGEGLPTGFIQGDQPGYMSAAREYFDQGFSLTYRDPFVPFTDGPSIYFQPQTFLLGFLWFLSHLDPGLLFVVFGAASAIVCARVALALYEHVAGTWDAAAKWGALLFFWGGGFLTLAGALTSPAYTFRTGEAMLFGNLFRWDPFEGWWFLNFGRNLIMPLEAYYHAVFFGAVLAFLKERYLLSGALLFLLCASHPFSGSELLAVLLVWGAAEGFVFGASAAIRRFFGLAAAIGVLHVAYYLIFLPRFPEHAALLQQWNRWWVLDWRSAFFAYSLVGVLAAVALFGRGALRVRENRLLLLWFVVALALAKHELFTDHPSQPLHFTRGYVWTPLFLLCIPVVLRFIRGLLRRRSLISALALAAFFAVFLLDNGIWLTAVGRGYLIEHVRRTREQEEVFGVLNSKACAGSAVLTSDDRVAFLSTVYTPLRPWVTYRRAVDDSVRRAQIADLLSRGKWSAAWAGWKLAVVLDRWPGGGDTTGARALGALRGHQRLLLENRRYTVVLVENAGEGGGKTENPP